VIFVHGNSSSARTWQQVMAGPFRQSFRCLAFDWSVRTPVMTAG
jgi:pimeloyl-ACP methyl ester carboxylesterase